jgi:hypothetical protein
MVGDDIRLTRCTTCDTEHPYKGGKVPRLRKKKSSVEAAYDEVLESVKHETPPQAILVTHSEPDAPEPPLAPLNEADAQEAPEHTDNGNASERTPEEERLHRPLIRAQLPRIEREPAARPVPEFTIRQANKNRGRFQNSSRPGRFAKGGGGHAGNARGPAGHQGRPGGRPQGHGSQMRSRPHGPHSGPKKRSR